MVLSVLMKLTLQIPDSIAARLKSAGGDLSRQALEALALEGYRDQALTTFEVSEMLGLSRIEAEDFLGNHHVELASLEESDLDREAKLFVRQGSKKVVSRDSARSGSAQKRR